MSAVARIAIASPANGLVVFDNNSATLFLYQQPGGWRKMLPVSNLGSKNPSLIPAPDYN